MYLKKITQVLTNKTHVQTMNCSKKDINLVCSPIFRCQEGLVTRTEFLNCGVQIWPRTVQEEPLKGMTLLMVFAVVFLAVMKRHLVLTQSFPNSNALSWRQIEQSESKVTNIAVESYAQLQSVYTVQLLLFLGSLAYSRVLYYYIIHYYSSTITPF